MSDRLIKESDVMRIAFQLPYVVNSAFFDAVKVLPSADRSTGEWILVKGSNGKDYHKCSKCLHIQEITDVKNYCAVCGARMYKGGEDE